MLHKIVLQSTHSVVKKRLCRWSILEFVKPSSCKPNHAMERDNIENANVITMSHVFIWMIRIKRIKRMKWFIIYIQYSYLVIFCCCCCCCRFQTLQSNGKWMWYALDWTHSLINAWNWDKKSTNISIMSKIRIPQTLMFIYFFFFRTESYKQIYQSSVFSTCIF